MVLKFRFRSLSFLIGLVLLVCLALTGCAPAQTPTPPPTPALTRVAASDLSGPLLFALNREYAAVNPGVVVAPAVLPASLLAEALAEGEADLALMIDTDPALPAWPLGYVTLAVVAHPDNPLEALDALQTAGLFGGEISDWAQAGGASGPVQVVVRATGSDGGLAFQRLALGGTEPTVNALAAPNWEAMRTLVGEEPGALGYLPRHEVDATVKELETPLDLRLLIVAAALAEPTGPARDFLAWAQSSAGQQVVARYAPGGELGNE